MHRSGTNYFEAVASADPGVPAPGNYGSPDGSCPEVAGSPGRVEGRRAGGRCVVVLGIVL